MKFLITITLFIFISGCSTTDFHNYGKLNSYFENYESHASYIQFNKDFAITAKHVDNINNPINCSVNCDLVFFKNNFKSFNNNIKWREPIFGEKVILVGNSKHNVTVKKHGIVLPHKIKTSSTDEFTYSINSAKSDQGMSGGPVYAVVDGAIIGMTIGMIKEDFSGLKKNSSIFIPYSLIIKEWSKINNSLDN